MTVKTNMDIYQKNPMNVLTNTNFIFSAVEKTDNLWQPIIHWRFYE